MVKYLLVKFSDGKTYRIPAGFIAKHRAEYYVNVDLEQGTITEQEKDAKMAKEIKCALSDSFEIIDWAQNNMDWTDIEENIELYKTESPCEPDYDSEWCNAEMRTLNE